jgi:hypothetical protein
LLSNHIFQPLSIVVVNPAESVSTVLDLFLLLSVLVGASTKVLVTDARAVNSFRDDK